ncbi:hypothetical protein Tco_1244149 [Tanacetum coccineum]
MTTLKFVDTHNMVAFLSKPTESDGFEQIVDFLNAHPIRYALTINPTIYIYCIEQLWSTIVFKTINGEVQLHALVDGKKIIVTEASVRSDLQLVDEEGVECLPNSTIFEQLALMDPKTTAWNEFSSTMASAIICLATNQKFNFSKFIFESMIRNLDNLSGKFLMYPRFVQVFLDQQLDGMPTHKRIYIAPSHTKKIFGNMRRVGKGFSGRVTPLFQTMVVQNQSQLGEGSTIPTDPHHTPTIIQSSTQPQKTQQPRKPKRKDTQVPQSSDPIENVADEAVHKELGDSLVRAATTASSLEAEQDSGNINKTQSKATPNESSSLGTTSGGGPRCQETMGDTIAQTRFENVSKHSNDSLLARVSLTARVESSDNEEILGEDASKQGRIDAIDADEEITLVSVQNVDKEMFDVNVLDGEEVFVAEQEVVVKDVSNVVSTAGDATTTAITTTAIITNVDDITKPKEKEDKGKGILVEPVKPIKNKDLIRLDEKVALKLQAEFNEEERLAREKAKKEKEANITLIETWDDIQAKIDVDYQLAERMQAQEQEELSIEEKATSFQQLLEKRRKHFVAKRVEEKRNKPPTKAQRRQIIAFKRVNTFENFRTELVEGKEKRAGTELIQENTKKQKVEDDKETTELKQLIKIIPDEEEVAIDAVPLAVKSPSIVDWKIYKEGRKNYYQIMRADGKSQMYMFFSQMLKSFDREDLEDLYKLVKAKYESTKLAEDLDLSS